MNSDIRLRSRNTGRLAAAIVGAAFVALGLSVGVSLLPFTARAAVDPHYEACHNNVQDTDEIEGADLKAASCADVNNDIPDLHNASLTTLQDTATSTTLVADDADGDLLYFEVTLAPSHGTLSVIDSNTAYAPGNLPTVTYTPAAGYAGPDVFEIKANDGLAGEDDLTGQLATFHVEVLAPAVPVTPACTTLPSTYSVDVTQQITNDPDSGFFGNWALDTFTRHIQIWQNTDDISGGVTYCAKATDSGSFITTGPKSPNSDVALTSGILGTMTGGSGIVTVVSGTLGDTGSWGTSGTIASPDCSVSGECDGLTGKWMANYFPTGTITYPDWSWTYNACGHGTWVNAGTGSTGDILSAGSNCAAASHTSQAVTVRAADLAADLSAVLADASKWFFYNDETDTIDNTLGSFVLGPSTAPLGDGSAEMTVFGTQRSNIATYQFKSIKLADITALTFSTYSHSSTTAATANRAPYLNFNVSFNGADTWQKRLAFVPNLNGSVTTDTWQNWNAVDTSSQWVYSGATWPAPNAALSGSTPLTWSQILTDYPDIQTRATDSWFGFRVGEPYADGFTGNVDNFAITIDNGMNATTTTFNFEPTDPSCAPGQHLDNHVCVADPASTGSGSSGSGSNGGGGVVGSGPLSIGFVNTNPTTGGLVLGTSTEALPASCSIYLTSYLRQGNSGADVERLQTFLNSYMNAGLPVTGFFGPLTLNAVKAFQLKYWDEILKPWVTFGLESDHTPTGYVYKTTERMINLMQCNNAIQIPQPQLP
jgi:hypothetical protein